MTIEAMKQALEALTYIHTETSQDEDELIHHAITSLCQAIAEAEKQEPVAILNHAHGVHVFRNVKLNGLPDGEYSVYTHPQPKREWQGLTDKDKVDFINQDFGGNRLDAMDWAEKRLKEKNT
jgi:hypothetical protein